MSDLRVKRGDTIPLVVGPILRSDGEIQNITGYTVRATLKARITDADPGVAQSTGTITDGPGGMARVEFAASVTDGFTADRVLLWDVQISDPGGVKKTVDSGKLFVMRDVTRA